MKTGWKRGVAVDGVTAAIGGLRPVRRGAPSRRARTARLPVNGSAALRDHRDRGGIVKATPDTAEFSFGVETQGATSTEALQRTAPR